MYSKTRWLTLFPAIERILKLYPALKSYFQSQGPNETWQQLTNFFDNPINKAYLWFVHSMMSLLHPQIKSVESADHSALDTLYILQDLEDKVLTRKVNNFLPLKMSYKIFYYIDKINIF